MEKDPLLLIHANILPKVYLKVIQAKQLLESGEAKSASEAARLCGISRSAFYKYKDAVFLYNRPEGETLSLQAQLTDEAGVLSALLKGLSDSGANVLTVNQSVPVNGRATVSVTVAAEQLKTEPEELLQRLAGYYGVLSIRVM